MHVYVARHWIAGTSVAAHTKPYADVRATGLPRVGCSASMSLYWRLRHVGASNGFCVRAYIDEHTMRDSSNTYDLLCADGATHSLSTLRSIAGLYTRNDIMVVVDRKEIVVWMYEFDKYNFEKWSNNKTAHPNSMPWPRHARQRINDPFEFIEPKLFIWNFRTFFWFSFWTFFCGQKRLSSWCFFFNIYCFRIHFGAISVKDSNSQSCQFSIDYIQDINNKISICATHSAICSNDGAGKSYSLGKIGYRCMCKEFELSPIYFTWF